MLIQEGNNLHRRKRPAIGMSLVLFLELNPPGSLVGIRNVMGRPMVVV